MKKINTYDYKDLFHSAVKLSNQHAFSVQRKIIWAQFLKHTLLMYLFLCLYRRAHTLTVLFILTCALVYVTLLEETPQDTAYNTKRYVGTRAR